MIESSASASVPDFGFGKAFGRFQGLLANQERSGKSRENSAIDEKSGTGSVEASRTASPSDRAEIALLQQIDRRVRDHERAHLAAGDGVVRGGASFTYTRGPDGKNYAIAGEVPIDTSPGRTPEETVDKAAAIERAALAPADPSSQDRRIAGQARGMGAEAALEVARNKASARGDSTGSKGQGEAFAEFYRRVERSGSEAADLSALLAIA